LKYFREAEESKGLLENMEKWELQVNLAEMEKLEKKGRMVLK